MIGVPGLLLTPSSLYQKHHSFYSFTLYTQHSHLLQNIQANLKHSCTKSKISNGHLHKSIGKCLAQSEDNKCHTNESKLVLDVQTLKNFPAEKLDGEFVMLRFDLILLLELLDIHHVFGNRTLSTIRYLYDAGAKVLLVSNWGRSGDPMVLTVESVADWRGKFSRKSSCFTPFSLCLRWSDLCGHASIPNYACIRNFCALMLSGA